MARSQQRRSRDRERRLLVPPATADASTRSARPGLPERADGTAGRAHRHRALLGRVSCAAAALPAPRSALVARSRRRAARAEAACPPLRLGASVLRLPPGRLPLGAGDDPLRRGAEDEVGWAGGTPPDLRAAQAALH